MTSPLHDTLAIRLAGILLQLNQGESVCRYDLAEQFGVSERTIYRDLSRLADVVVRLPDGRYQLAPEHQGKLQAQDLEVFAKLTGVNQLFPNSGHRFFRSLLNPDEHRNFLVKAHHHENGQPKDLQFQQLNKAIRQHRQCRLVYAEKPRTLFPYRLVNSKGIWYLAATENGQLKAFTLSRISLLHITDQTFVPQPQVHRQIEDDDDIWFSKTKTPVRLSVAPAIAYYFLRRPVVPGQQIVQTLESGELIVSSLISHANQILSIIRFWIPHVRILVPAWLEAQLNNELKHYLHSPTQTMTGTEQ
ncbi:DNA-binding protein [Pseudomonas sp. RIT-PI-q]|nr:DNA-binding protein [Pseudomonas sp. RIT-PI-q]